MFRSRAFIFHFFYGLLNKIFFFFGVDFTIICIALHLLSITIASSSFVVYYFVCEPLGLLVFYFAYVALRRNVIIFYYLVCTRVLHQTNDHFKKLKVSKIYWGLGPLWCRYISYWEWNSLSLRINDCARVILKKMDSTKNGCFQCVCSHLVWIPNKFAKHILINLIKCLYIML